MREDNQIGTCSCDAEILLGQKFAIKKEDFSFVCEDCINDSDLAHLDIMVPKQLTNRGFENV